MPRFTDSPKGRAGRPGPAAPRTARTRKPARPPRRRGRLLAIAGAAAAVLAAGGLYLADSFFGTASARAPKGAGADSIAVGYEKAPATLTVYSDFNCAACRSFEDTFGPTIRQLQSERRLRVDYKPISASGDTASAGAANALACAQDSGRFDAFRQALARAGATNLNSKSGLLSVAGHIDGLRTPQFDKCVQEDTYTDWVDRLSREFAEQPHTDAIVATLNGKQVELGGPETARAFRNAVVDLALKDPTFVPPGAPQHGARPSVGPAPAAQPPHQHHQQPQTPTQTQSDPTGARP